MSKQSYEKIKADPVKYRRYLDQCKNYRNTPAGRVAARRAYTKRKGAVITQVTARQIHIDKQVTYLRIKIIYAIIYGSILDLRAYLMKQPQDVVDRMGIDITSVRSISKTLPQYGDLLRVTGYQHWGRNKEGRMMRLPMRLNSVRLRLGCSTQGVKDE